MKIALKNVLPNPFRDIDNYPTNAKKIETLVTSIEDTEFWENIVCRETPESTKNNRIVQIAYGHHRMEALRQHNEKTGKYPEVELIVKKLPDSQMLKIMANENLQEWGHSSDIERETVKAVVVAYAEGKIELNKPPAKQSKKTTRYAPSFCAGWSSEKLDHPYTAESVRKFLGWKGVDAVRHTLEALCLIEQGILKESQLDGLSSGKAYVVVSEVNKAVKLKDGLKKEADIDAEGSTEGRAVQIYKKAEEAGTSVVALTAKAVSDTLHKGGSVSEAKNASIDARKHDKPEAELPDIGKATSKISTSITQWLEPDRAMAKKLDSLMLHIKNIDASALNDLDMSLSTLIEYAQEYKNQIKK